MIFICTLSLCICFFAEHVCSRLTLLKEVSTTVTKIDIHSLGKQDFSFLKMCDSDDP